VKPSSYAAKLKISFIKKKGEKYIQEGGARPKPSKDVRKEE